MRFSLIQLRAFETKWRRAGLGDEDLQALEQAIVARPERGDVVRGAGGLRKVRFAPPSSRRGKTGATRVCYVAYPEYGLVYLVTFFEKKEQANLTPAERNAIKALLARLGRGLARGDPP